RMADRGTAFHDAIAQHATALGQSLEQLDARADGGRVGRHIEPQQPRERRHGPALDYKRDHNRDERRAEQEPAALGAGQYRNDREEYRDRAAKADPGNEQDLAPPE